MCVYIIGRYVKFFPCIMSLQLAKVVFYVFVLLETIYPIYSLLILSEQLQVNSRLYIGIYLVTHGLVLFFWIECHRRFTEETSGTVHSSEVRILDDSTMRRTGQASVWIFEMCLTIKQAQILLCLFWLLSIFLGLFFFVLSPNLIYPGDGHIVQNGIDTKSPLLYLWHMNLLLIIAVAVQILLFFFG